MAGKLKATTSKCAGCGDDMRFNPETQSLICPSCKATKEIKAIFSMPTHDVKTALKSHKNQEWANKMTEMECPNCGAKSILNQYQTTSKCQYCETPLLAKSDNFSGLKPDSIIPFQFGKEKAQENFKAKLSSKWLVPKKLKKNLQADSIHGYYFPAFVFNANCITNYQGRLYNNETEKDKDGNSKTVRKYFSIAGTQDTAHKGIEIEASTKLSQFELNSVRPYDFTKAKGYMDEFVYGYPMENYSSSVEETNLQARTVIKQEIKNIILRKYSYDGVDYLDMNTQYLVEQYNYSVLPMYRINYTYKNKNYSNLMNGQTGKLGGNYPKSFLKIGLIVLLVLAIIGIPILFIILASMGVL